MKKSDHRVLIETLVVFWFYKKHRWVCKSCNEHGRWTKVFAKATADGWYHDTVRLFELLTAPPSE